MNASERMVRISNSLLLKGLPHLPLDSSSLTIFPHFRTRQETQHDGKILESHLDFKAFEEIDLLLQSEPEDSNLSSQGTENEQASK